MTITRIRFDEDRAEEEADLPYKVVRKGGRLAIFTERTLRIYSTERSLNLVELPDPNHPTGFTLEERVMQLVREPRPKEVTPLAIATRLDDYLRIEANREYLTWLRDSIDRREDDFPEEFVLPLGPNEDDPIREYTGIRKIKGYTPEGNISFTRTNISPSKYSRT